MVMNNAEFVYDTSSPPMCSGISGWIVNCSSGCSSSATLVFPLRIPPGRAETDRGALAGNRAIDAQHAGRYPEKEQHDDRERAGAEHAIDRPTQRCRDADRDDELDADAEANSESLLLPRIIAAGARLFAPPRPRLIEPPAELRQFIRRPLIAHRSSHCQRHQPRPKPVEAARKIKRQCRAVKARAGLAMSIM